MRGDRHEGPYLNRTAHCEMCSTGVRNVMRTHVCDDGSEDSGFAVCPVHDIAGPVVMLPTALRRVVTP